MTAHVFPDGPSNPLDAVLLQGHSRPSTRHRVGATGYRSAVSYSAVTASGWLTRAFPQPLASLRDQVLTGATDPPVSLP